MRQVKPWKERSVQFSGEIVILETGKIAHLWWVVDPENSVERQGASERERERERQSERENEPG
jgi:hypothetical protein